MTYKIVEKLRHSGWVSQNTYEESDVPWKAAAHIEALAAVIERCRDKFAEYAELHRAKIGTKDANTPAKMDSVLEKVERNLAMARECDAALSNLREGQGE